MHYHAAEAHASRTITAKTEQYGCAQKLEVHLLCTSNILAVYSSSTLAVDTVAVNMCASIIPAIITHQFKSIQFSCYSVEQPTDTAAARLQHCCSGAPTLLNQGSNTVGAPTLLQQGSNTAATGIQHCCTKAPTLLHAAGLQYCTVT